LSALKFGSPNNAYVIHTDPDLFHYDYDVDCNSDGVLEKRHARGDYTCLYRRPGRYWICINGTFPSIRHGSKTDAKKLVSIDQWGYDGVPQSVKDSKQAEFLLERQFPWQLVSRIGVFSGQVRNRVLVALDKSKHRPRVQVMKEWYY